MKGCPLFATMDCKTDDFLLIFAAMRKYAIIVAGGSGTRMGGNLPKQFMLRKQVLTYSYSFY